VTKTPTLQRLRLGDTLITPTGRRVEVLALRPNGRVLLGYLDTENANGVPADKVELKVQLLRWPERR
jgi:hypothetical protein